MHGLRVCNVTIKNKMNSRAIGTRPCVLAQDVDGKSVLSRTVLNRDIYGRHSKPYPQISAQFSDPVDPFNLRVEQTTDNNVAKTDLG